MKIAVGNSRMDKRWKNKDITWPAFKDTVRTTRRTTETVSEFRKMTKARQDSIKDIGGFVGGALREGKRRNGYVLCRSLLTLDMDYATPDTWDQLESLYDWACCLYSTHKHTPEAPRLRLVIPLEREVSEDEYPALGRMVAKEIGIDMFDDTDHLRLPELIMNEVFVQMSTAEEKHYQTMKDDMVLSLKGKEIDAANSAALSGKLLQMANGAVYDEDHGVAHLHARKLDALEDLIEAANGKPVLIAYWFKHDLERILERFPAEQLASADSIRRWNNGEIPIAVIHPASAGHGLNLQSGGSTLVWFSLTWSLELYQQTNARLWRQGQKETVVIHHIIAKGTIDEQVMKALRLKENVQAALIAAVRANLSKEVIE